MGLSEYAAREAMEIPINYNEKKTIQLSNNDGYMIARHYSSFMSFIDILGCTLSLEQVINTK